MYPVRNGAIGGPASKIIVYVIVYISITIWELSWLVVRNMGRQVVVYTPRVLCYLPAAFRRSTPVPSPLPWGKTRARCDERLMCKWLCGLQGGRCSHCRVYRHSHVCYTRRRAAGISGHHCEGHGEVEEEREDAGAVRLLNGPMVSRFEVYGACTNS